MLRIIIADDHTLFRKGIKFLLENKPDIIEVAEAADGNELIKKLRNELYDIVILDIAMPGRNGLDIIKQIKIEMPELPVLILSMYPEEQYAVRMIKSGAEGYITKESAPQDLIKAIRKIINGEKYISSILMDRLVCHISRGYREFSHERLSDREFEVMCKIAQGKKLTNIADELCLSRKTISTYRSRILEKMNFTENVEIVRYVHDNNLFEI